MSSERLACIMEGAGEGKSTLAAALAERKRFDAIHFCKKANVRRQNKALVIRSLSYQLASLSVQCLEAAVGAALEGYEGYEGRVRVGTADYPDRCPGRVSRGRQGSEPSDAPHDGDIRNKRSVTREEFGKKEKRE